MGVRAIYEPRDPDTSFDDICSVFFTETTDALEADLDRLACPVVEDPSGGSDGDSSDPDSGFVCSGDCTSAIELYADAGSQNIGSGSAWYVWPYEVGGWQVSNGAGRTIEVNGVVVPPGSQFLPDPASDGKYYFYFSEGDLPYASWSIW